jgi:hypothetical protein
MYKLQSVHHLPGIGSSQTAERGMRDDGGWGVGDGGSSGGNNWGMSSVGGDWGMSSVSGDWGMSGVGGDWGMGSITGHNRGGMSVGGHNWGGMSVSGHYWSVSHGEGIIGDASVELADAGEGTVHSFGVMRDGLVATEGTDDALVGGADGWGMDGVGSGVSHGDWGMSHGQGGGVSYSHGGGLVDVSGADSRSGRVSGHGGGSDETGIGVGQSGGEDDELQIKRV